MRASAVRHGSCCHARHGFRSPASPLVSAIVVMLGDTSAGLEVFLLERHGLSDVLGAAYVFPGGEPDRADAELASGLDQPASALRTALGEPVLDDGDAAALYVAAIREAFEEAGALVVPFGQATLRSAQAQHRAGVRDVAEGLGVPLAAASLLPWSRWVTPLNSVLACAQAFLCALLRGRGADGAGAGTRSVRDHRKHEAVTRRGPPGVLGRSHPAGWRRKS